MESNSFSSVCLVCLLVCICCVVFFFSMVHCSYPYSVLTRRVPWGLHLQHAHTRTHTCTHILMNGENNEGEKTYGRDGKGTKPWGNIQEIEGEEKYHEPRGSVKASEQIKRSLVSFWWLIYDCLTQLTINGLQKSVVEQPKYQGQICTFYLKRSMSFQSHKLLLNFWLKWAALKVFIYDYLRSYIPKWWDG